MGTVGSRLWVTSLTMASTCGSSAAGRRDGGLLVTAGAGGPRSQDVTCTAQQLALGEVALKTRMSVGETNVLGALMLDGGTWSGLPHP